MSEGSILIQPIGAIEQHGAHLPLSTDWLIVSAAAEAVVADRGDDLDLWLLPPLAYGKSNEHAWAAGTVWLSVTTLLSVLDDIGRCAAMTPARRLVLLNGHGGNSALLGVACRELRLDHGLLTFLLHPWVPRDQGGPGSDEEMGLAVHGGMNETSTVLHLRPDLVDMSKAVRNIPEWMDDFEHVRFGSTVPFGWSSRDFGPAGSIGDPTLATAELGKRQFEASIARLGEALEEVSRFDFEQS